MAGTRLIYTKHPETNPDPVIFMLPPLVSTAVSSVNTNTEFKMPMLLILGPPPCEITEDTPELNCTVDIVPDCIALPLSFLGIMFIYSCAASVTYSAQLTDSSSHLYNFPSVGMGMGASQRQLSSFMTQLSNGRGGIKASRWAS